VVEGGVQQLCSRIIDIQILANLDVQTRKMEIKVTPNSLVMIIRIKCQGEKHERRPETPFWYSLWMEII
jgi:hypothetical protein